MTPFTTAEDIMAFWFSPQVKARWFKATAEFDREVEQRCMPLYREAQAGNLAHWEQSATGALALVILLDQIPLNVFRSKPESFATEAASRAVAERAIARGFERQLTDEQKLFLYMPYMHSEDLSDQNRSIKLFASAGLQDNLKWANHHRDIVVRFGRFPHRNAILGRASTPEETAYLNSDEAFLG